MSVASAKGSRTNGSRANGARPSHAERYDRAYFDHWYRDPKHRVKDRGDLSRQARLVVGAAEHILGRPIRSVLDVGCGEGQWRAELRRLRPGVKYTGVDASEYAVRRWGKRRNIRLGTIETLGRLRLASEYDVVLCVGFLNYLSADELRRGLANVYDHLDGVAYLEIFSREDDDVFGDITPEQLRPARWYRRVARDAGLVACGLHCYVPHWLVGHTAALERAGV